MSQEAQYGTEIGPVSDLLARGRYARDGSNDDLVKEDAAVDLANIDLSHGHLFQFRDAFGGIQRQAQVTGEKVRSAQRHNGEDLLSVENGLCDGGDRTVSSSRD